MIEPASVERFRKDMERLVGPVPSRFGLAVSGGPDSLALLRLAAAAFPGRTQAAGVDHGLRPAAGAELNAAADLASGVGVTFQVLTVTVESRGLGLQGDAREARYQALAGWATTSGLPLLLTAHHADDQAETMLMRLGRGSGLSGLAGIRAARPLAEGVRLIRPLLAWRRRDLAAIVAEAGWTAADDPSNRDPRFDRTRARTRLQSTDLDPRRLARSAAALDEADRALEWMADRCSDRIVSEGGALTLDPWDLPRAVRRRLLARALDRLCGACGLPPPRGSIETLLAALEAGETSTRAGIRAEGGRVWRLAPARPRRAAD